MADVWLDVATPKQAIFATYLKKELVKKGFKTEIIAREETQTIDLLILLKTKFVKLGEYGESLKEKLSVETERTANLLRHFEEKGFPNVCWSHGLVSGIRTAFGLGMPVVYNNDTLHNVPIAKLTVPLATYLIIPEVFTKKSWASYGLDKSRIIRFKGIEELAWVKHLKQDRERIVRQVIGENVDRLVLMRGIEYKAVYSFGVKKNMSRVIEELSQHATVVYLTRYQEERSEIRRMRNVFIPDKAPFAPELAGVADLVIGSGGTLCREAALQGTPTISFYFKDPIIKYLVRRGFPIRYVSEPHKVLSHAETILRRPSKYRKDTSAMLEEMESPIPITIKHINEALS